jgi:hypothetical protein
MERIQASTTQTSLWGCVSRAGKKLHSAYFQYYRVVLKRNKMKIAGLDSYYLESLLIVQYPPVIQEKAKSRGTVPCLHAIIVPLGVDEG